MNDFLLMVDALGDEATVGVLGAAWAGWGKHLRPTVSVAAEKCSEEEDCGDDEYVGEDCGDDDSECESPRTPVELRVYVDSEDDEWK